MSHGGDGPAQGAVAPPAARLVLGSVEIPPYTDDACAAGCELSFAIHVVPVPTNHTPIVM